MDQVLRKTVGAVLYNPLGEVVVVRQGENSWSLPKGGIDEGESEEEALAREVFEETGVTDFSIVEYLGSYERYRMGKDPREDDTTELKHISMYLCTTHHQPLAPTDPANPEARFVPKDEVSEWLTSPKDREFYLSVKNRIPV